MYMSWADPLFEILFFAFLLWAAVLFGHTFYEWAYAATTPKWHRISFCLIGGFVIYAFWTVGLARCTEF